MNIALLCLFRKIIYMNTEKLSSHECARLRFLSATPTRPFAKASCSAIYRLRSPFDGLPQRRSRLKAPITDTLQIFVGRLVGSPFSLQLLGVDGKATNFINSSEVQLLLAPKGGINTIRSKATRANGLETAEKGLGTQKLRQPILILVLPYARPVSAQPDQPTLPATATAPTQKGNTHTHTSRNTPPRSSGTGTPHPRRKQQQGPSCRRRPLFKRIRGRWCNSGWLHLGYSQQRADDDPQAIGDGARSRIIPTLATLLTSLRCLHCTVGHGLQR